MVEFISENPKDSEINDAIFPDIAKHGRKDLWRNLRRAKPLVLLG